MSEFLHTATNWFVMLFVVTGMAAMGLSLKFKEILSPLRNMPLVLTTLLLNFIAIPVLAIWLTKVSSLESPYATGLLLLGAAAGAPFLPKLVELAHGDIALSVAVMLLQTVGTILFLPLALPYLIPGLEANPWAIARPLLLLMLLPLGLGFITQQQASGLAKRLQPPFALTANVCLLVATLLLFILNVRGFLATFGSWAALLALVFVALAMILGYLAGSLRPGTASVQSLGAGQRNIAAGLVVATTNSLDPTVVIMLLLTTFVGLIPLLLGASLFRRGIFEKRK